ncbi:tRNA (N6-isopentenyl adenosine(37)-C2)-methylthiotransferase MiaB [Breznakiella homolactica]|uniref:tRNA-2-methylthio-N(6)-dimethylallyladenosine synthase n=1 Tax=Breznakiella homolactica TaxID=2798577 RepID=A0A7T7XJX6_9SPIR|nr:tRNA (N6-isopentenyl adenosine(37)-C2)-methylthiotransferase MiaB [Breznakiella homolactica]QQO07543.1 tRNA (N6-isopentenyl adenosine(37)-C2)-methylthiotransferase MiaB [Breznakiella homolactica]
MTFFFETYGCQMNTAESAALQLVLKERGWTEAPSGETADLVLLNTCSVRATAETRVMGRLDLYRALKKQKPFTLIVAGCMAQRMGESLRERNPAVDYVMGTASRSVFPQILAAAEQGRAFVPSDEAPVFSFSSSHLEDGQFRSFVPIMHGCNNFCSYCIVPYVRGREISRSPESIVREIRLLAERGVREITLLGQNVNSYKWDGEGPSLEFPDLLELVAEECGKLPIRWIRFLSSHPKDLSSRAIRVMADNPLFCRHLHLCVQHGSNAILGAMNRRYTREKYLDLVAEVREAMPGISLSTDILVGFPGETEEDLELTLDLMERVKFLYSYMYHYNPREGTAACDLPGRIPEEIKRQRLGRVIELQKGHTLELLKERIGSRETVLIEGISRKNADELIARTERDEMVAVPGSLSQVGSFAELTLSSLRGNTFRAKELALCPGD